MAPPTIPIEERFAKKYKVNKRTGCWMWTASIRPNGYSQFRYSKAKNGYGHIFSYEHHKGPVPEGMTIDHLCRNRACVNPEHLEAVKHQVNVLRGEGKAAANAKKTHCPRGHPYEGGNLYITSAGGRACRECQRLWREEHREELNLYHRDYMREYSRERYANDPAFREARKRQRREYAARLREDARRWRDSQK